MNQDHWHIERSVPLALILSFVTAVALQTVTAVWWAAGVNTRVNQLEESVRASISNGERLTRLEVKVDWLISTSQKAGKH